MAKHYAIVFSTFATDIENALNDYYGEGVAITSASGQEIKFSCPQICDKPLTISISKTSSYSTVYLKGVVDTTTFLNCNHYGGESASNPTGIHLILADNFLLLQSVDSGFANWSTTILVAKTTNGRYLCMGGGNSTKADGGICQFTDETENRPVWFMVPYQKQLRAGKKIPIVKSQLAIGGQVEMNEDGTIASIDGLYLTGESNSNAIVGLNFFLSNGIIRGNNTNGIYMPNAFYVELEV